MLVLYVVLFLGPIYIVCMFLVCFHFDVLHRETSSPHRLNSYFVQINDIAQRRMITHNQTPLESSIP